MGTCTSAVDDPGNTFPVSPSAAARVEGDVNGSSALVTPGGRNGVCGLRNLGNTCFMNAALQCLSNTAPLTEYFISQGWKADLNTNNPLGMRGAMAKSYGALLHKMWHGKSQVVSPTSFKSTVSEYAPRFNGYLQHDAQELLAFLLDGLHEDLNRVKKKPITEPVEDNGRPDAVVAAEAWSRYLARNKSIIVDLFQGQLKSNLTCNTCGKQSTTFDPFMYLSLPLEEPGGTIAQSLHRSLQLFVTEEQLRGDERWYCPKCKVFRDATKKFDLWKLPPILIVHLKRFKYGRTGARIKINSPIRFPTTSLDLGMFTTGPQTDPPMYRLHAVANHHGTMGGGHYTACAWNPAHNEWFTFNDSHVSRTGAGSVASSDAYLLFYHRLTKSDKRPVPPPHPPPPMASASSVSAGSADSASPAQGSHTSSASTASSVPHTTTSYSVSSDSVGEPSRTI